MTPPIEDAENVLTIVVCVLSAISIVAMAQVVTREAGIRCRLATEQLAQRIAMWMLAAFLILEAWHVYQTWRAPAGPALLVFIGIVLCVVTSFVRHRNAPAIPNGSSWQKGKPVARY